MSKKPNRVTRRKKLAQHRRKGDKPIQSTALSITGVPPIEFVPVIIDIWRVKQRSVKESSSERVTTGCDRALERLEKIGFRLEDHINHPYDEDMMITVIENEEGSESRHIVECISPSIYYQGILVQPGEVITRGKNNHG
jgi:hypothetical protein